MKIRLDKGHVNTLQTMEDALLAGFMPQNELLMRTFAKESLMVEECADNCLFFLPLWL